MPAKQEILTIAKDKIIYTQGSYGNYQYCNTYDELVDIINKNQNICEYISDKKPVNLYFDIDAKQQTLEKVNFILCTIDIKIRNKFNYNIKRILLSSYSDNKLSYHIIYRFSVIDDLEEENIPVLFDNVYSIKNLCFELEIDNIVNMQVYRDSLFRTYNSYKYGENRLFIKDSQSDEFDFKETFVCWAGCSNPIIISVNNMLENIKLNKNTINSTISITNKDLTSLENFVQQHYNRL